MARPREFDEAEVLDAAIQQFWLHGYEATSVRDLAEEMGIAGASLYNAFGDKRALYRSSLNRYLEQTFRERIRRLECSLPPREAISAFFHEIVDRSLTDKKRRGCMLVNSTLENVPDDRDFQQIVATFLSDVESFFQRSVAAGQREGTIGTSHSSQDFARLLLGILLGVRVLARVRPDRELLEGMMRPVFALLDAPMRRGPNKFRPSPQQDFFEGRHDETERIWFSVIPKRRPYLETDQMHIEERHDASANEVAAIEHRLYEHNCRATGFCDGKDLGFVARDEDGNVIGAVLGYSWGGISELRQLWVAEPNRRRGLGSALLDRFIDEARRRGVRRIWLATYDFQTPALYERAGFVRVVDLKDWPVGHTNSILCLKMEAA